MGKESAIKFRDSYFQPNAIRLAKLLFFLENLLLFPSDKEYGVAFILTDWYSANKERLLADNTIDTFFKEIDIFILAYFRASISAPNIKNIDSVITIAKTFGLEDWIPLRLRELLVESSRFVYDLGIYLAHLNKKEVRNLADKKLAYDIGFTTGGSVSIPHLDADEKVTESHFRVKKVPDSNVYFGAGPGSPFRDNSKRLTEGFLEMFVAKKIKYVFALGNFFMQDDFTDYYCGGIFGNCEVESRKKEQISKTLTVYNTKIRTNGKEHEVCVYHIKMEDSHPAILNSDDHKAIHKVIQKGKLVNIYIQCGRGVGRTGAFVFASIIHQKNVFNAASDAEIVSNIKREFQTLRSMEPNAITYYDQLGQVVFELVVAFLVIESAAMVHDGLIAYSAIQANNVVDDENLDVTNKLVK